MDMYEIVKKLIGNIKPRGETYADDERLTNLNEHSLLTCALVEDLFEVAMYKDRTEYSMRKLGQRAYDELLELKEILSVIE